MSKNKILVFVATFNEKQNISDLFYDIIKISPEYDVLIIDDMIDTAGTICNAARTAKENGALSVKAIATHPVLSGPAIKRLTDSVISKVCLLYTSPSPRD